MSHLRTRGSAYSAFNRSWQTSSIQPGFRLLSDLNGVKSMPTTTAPFIGQIMELCADRGLESVVRVLPSEPRNDIGYAILSQFHYGPDVRIRYMWQRGTGRESSR